MDDLIERLREHASYLQAMDEGTKTEIVVQCITAMNEAATRLAEVDAERDGLREALDSIDVYGSDTLSGRVKPDPATYKAWLIEGIVEMRNRARAALGARP